MLSDQRAMCPIFLWGAYSMSPLKTSSQAGGERRPHRSWLAEFRLGLEARSQWSSNACWHERFCIGAGVECWRRCPMVWALVDAGYGRVVGCPIMASVLTRSLFQRCLGRQAHRGVQMHALLR